MNNLIGAVVLGVLAAAIGFLVWAFFKKPRSPLDTRTAEKRRTEEYARIKETPGADLVNDSSLADEHRARTAALKDNFLGRVRDRLGGKL